MRPFANILHKRLLEIRRKLPVFQRKTFTIQDGLEMVEIPDHEILLIKKAQEKRDRKLRR